MSWAQLLLWSVLLSFASWASILFVITIGSGVRAMWPEDFVHETLKGGGSPEQAER